jgi:DUF4097 and DUF4098 domain-containing protein YvlB
MAAPAFSSIEDSIKKSFSVEPGGKLVLETDIGSIEVLTRDTDKLDVEVMREARTASSRKAKRMMKDMKIDFRQDGNTVYISAEYEREGFSWFWDNFIGNRLRVKFLISVPQRFNVDLKTKGGGISIDDLEGEVLSKTSGGSLKFNRIQGPVWGRTSGGSIKLLSCEGKADVRSSGGSITIGEVKGNIFAHTSGGGIKIGKAEGEVDASTSGGSIRVEEVMGTIRARSSGGSITASISGQPASDCRLTTSGGSITVYMAEDLRVDVNASTSGGRVHTDFPVTIQGEISRSNLNAKINGGGPELYLHTSGGSIHIRKM